MVVHQIRIPVLGEWRVLYVARFAGAVYVLHAFRKKTQKTRREGIDLYGWPLGKDRANKLSKPLIHAMMLSAETQHS